MGVSVTEIAVVGELKNAQKVARIDFGGGIAYEFGLCLYGGKVYGTKKIVFVNATQHPSLSVDTVHHIVGIGYFNEYRAGWAEQKPAMANAFFAALTPNTNNPGANNTFITVTAAGLDTNAGTGFYIDAAGVISSSAAVELTPEEKAAKAVAAILGSKGTATATSTFSFTETIKKPITWVIAGLVGLGIFLVLGKKKKGSK